MIGVIDLAAAFVTPLLAPIVVVDGNKTGKKCTGGGIPANIVLSVGAGGGSATVTIEESADDVTYTPLLDYTGTQVSFSIVAGSAGTTTIKNGNRTKSYVRAKVASTSGTIVAGVNLIEGNVYAAPAGEAGGFQTAYDAGT